MGRASKHKAAPPPPYARPLLAAVGWAADFGRADPFDTPSPARPWIVQFKKADGGWSALETLGSHEHPADAERAWIQRAVDRGMWDDDPWHWQYRVVHVGAGVYLGDVDAPQGTSWLELRHLATGAVLWRSIPYFGDASRSAAMGYALEAARNRPTHSPLPD